MILLGWNAELKLQRSTKLHALISRVMPVNLTELSSKTRLTGVDEIVANISHD